MKVKQIGVFIENRSGRLREVLEVLDDNKINIRALSLADTSDYGILRLIVDRFDDAVRELKKANFTLSETDVIAVNVSSRPGVLEILHDEDLNVEYMYSFVGKFSDNVDMILRIENIEEASKLLC